MITKAKKQTIVAEASEYLEAKGLSQNEFARIVGISSAYMSDIMNGKLVTGPKKSPIKDSYYIKIARAVGVTVETPLWWHIDTDNYVAIIDTFQQAREQKVPFAVDGETGMGKSYTAEMYLKMYPTNTYIVVCDNDLTAKSFMSELAYAIGVKPLGATYNIRKSIVRHLKGKLDVLLIIDEAENLKERAWGSIKRVMDDLKYLIGLVFIGANGFEKMLEKKANKLINPFPQVNSRIREGGFKQLFDFEETDILGVCDQHQITDKEVITILRNKCRNMRELAGAIIKLKRAQKATPDYTLIDLAKHELAA